MMQDPALTLPADPADPSSVVAVEDPWKGLLGGRLVLVSRFYAQTFARQYGILVQFEPGVRGKAINLCGNAWPPGPPTGDDWRLKHLNAVESPKPDASLGLTIPAIGLV